MTKANAVEEEITQPCDYITSIIHKHNWCDSDVTFC